MRYSSLSIMAAAIASTANAHMKLMSPVPFGDATLDKAPLHGNGDDFPCKQRAGVYLPPADMSNNTFAIGQKNLMSFFGTAVHGGGSCQIAITPEKAPTASTKWMVIHSIEGGCPAKNQPLNFDESMDPRTAADKYEWSIPDGIPPGDYTFAWTWFNTVGNREMYMNCAPIKVTGGSTKRSVEKRKEESRFAKRANFPDLFKANIFGDSGCKTTENINVQFPDPGASVVRLKSPLGPPVGSCAGGSSNSPPAQPVPSSSVAAPSAPASSTSTSAAAPNPTGGVFLPTAGTTFPASEPSAPAVPSQPEPSPPSEPAPPTPTGGSTGNGSALTGACTSEGMWNCIGGTSFQRCASGRWSVAQALAAGTKCGGGQDMKLNMSVGKRHPRHLARHRAHVKAESGSS